jgi:ankyrin repeat domain-containing protein 17
MQNVAQGSTSENQKPEKVNIQHDIGKSSTPISSNSSPTKSETETFSELQPRFMTDSSESEEEDVSEVILPYPIKLMNIRLASRSTRFQ